MNFINRHIGDHESDLALVNSRSSIADEGKWPVRYDSVEFVAICADIATILFAGFLSALLSHGSPAPAGLGQACAYAAAASVSFVYILKGRGLYRPTELLVLRSQVRAICLTWILLHVLAAAVEMLDDKPQFFRGAGLLFAALGLASLIAQRCVARTLLIKCFSGRKFARTNLVLITDQPPSNHAGLSETLAVLGYCVKGRFGLPAMGSDPGSRKRLSCRVIEHIRNSEVDKIVLEANPERWADLRAFISDLRVLPFPIVFVPVGAASELLRHPTRSLGSAACVEIQPGPLTAIERASKRIIDIIGAGFALMVFAPLLAMAAVAIRLDSPGPILFKQQRCGFNGRIFSIRKFRTMHVLENGPVVVQATPLDPRITRVGRWLRRTSFDELPQLLNVLDGSMSLVGPRPHAVAHDGQFEKLVRKYAFRRRVRPGLTGWAQIHGCRGPTPTATMVERRVEYDLWYIDNWSLRLDLAILLRTPMEVLRGRNAC
ncbi:exopolysaccharide biosynthesis polyprenyl glycosylphosphotransferase [Bradyrhizobium sp. 147]|uniref:exopolysaccharide biosynthesis polyprenyl glycosylphosphotransferase n=1 Tax=unclassified Bradyrhizobium TaxID=2631580 RepID=UPI001FFBB221|nr:MULTISPECIES: exopolysaccharide biosynthesis polyprenyl glycosylphosphotransferase [unclassified Bradyrhizobium]MCK1682385.1 exopolysaccharide biosynthesis polyprenyl glycosylphosphotransferase [Bradyrhizobium sp. 147]MCK1757032.1 exopolysaccharide biosynthesis polyprenyl glycosylphosphotransferase [Bradyrhizobium sp. 137]